MGSEMAQRLEANAGTLSPRARLVVMRMAWTVLDPSRPSKREPCLYFGGWEHLALLFPDLAPLSAKRAVLRALTEAEAAGYIKREGHAHRRSRQVYRLTY